MTSEARNSQMPSLPLVSPVSGLASTVCGMFMLRALRLELWHEVFRGAGHAVLVRPPVDNGLGQEVPVSRRRRSGPLERGGFPRVLIDESPPFDAAEEVDDERNLE